jgi:hypothetical protein
MVTYSQLASRIDEMVAVAKQAFIKLNYTDEDIEDNIKKLYARINNAKGKRYGDGLIHHLVSAKRQVRNTIRGAIMHSPARKKQIEGWRKEYSAMCDASAAKSVDGKSTLGFFETEFGSKLRMSMKPYKSFFLLTPKYSSI